MVFILLLLLFAVVEVEASESISYRAAQDLIALLGRYDVRTELSISDAQRSAGRDAQRRLKREYNILSSDLTISERTFALRRIYVQKFEAINETLRPEQSVRLRELHKQHNAIHYGTYSAMEGTVDLTPQQRAAIQEKEETLGQELTEMLWSFHSQSQNALMEVLPHRHQMAWKRIIGDEFQFNSPPDGSGVRLLRALDVQFIDPSLSLDSGDADLADDNTLLFREDVRKELEIVDDQIAAMNKSKSAFEKKSKEIAAKRSQLSLGNIDEKERAKLLNEIISVQTKMLREILEDKRKLRDESLLPHQLERLSELRWRYRALNGPVDAFSRALPLIDDTVTKMRRKENKLRDELLETLWSFHERAQQEILEELTDEQRVIWLKSKGKDFKFENETQGLGILQVLH